MENTDSHVWALDPYDRRIVQWQEKKGHTVDTEKVVEGVIDRAKHLLPTMPKKLRGKYEKRIEAAEKSGDQEGVLHVCEALISIYNRSIKNHAQGE